MKKLGLTILILSCLAIQGCSDDDSNSNSNGNATAVANNLKSGTWKITNFSEDDVVETSNFQGYNFTFGTNNIIIATNGTNSYTGVWSVTDGNSGDDDNSSSDIDVNIAFTSPDAFTELTEDWDVSARTGVKIDLVHVSGGNGGTDHLTFEKN